MISRRAGIQGAEPVQWLSKTTLLRARRSRFGRSRPLSQYSRIMRLFTESDRNNTLLIHDTSFPPCFLNTYSFCSSFIPLIDHIVNIYSLFFSPYSYFCLFYTYSSSCFRIFCTILFFPIPLLFIHPFHIPKICKSVCRARTAYAASFFPAPLRTKKSRVQASLHPEHIYTPYFILFPTDPPVYFPETRNNIFIRLPPAAGRSSP